MLAILGQIVLQWLVPNASSLPPGEARGDINIPEDCLPDEIGAWSRTAFTPAGQNSSERVWVSTWQYQSATAAATVSFDQAGYTGWHELSDCYVATGWTHKSRESLSLKENSGNDWPYVVSKFTNDSGQTALVVFSLFFDDGGPVFPPAYDLSKPAEQQGGLLNKFGNRFSDLHPSQQRQDPTRQCQVFAVARDVTKEMETSLVALHVKSRRRFLDHWKASVLSVDSQTGAEQTQ